MTRFLPAVALVFLVGCQTMPWRQDAQVNVKRIGPKTVVAWSAQPAQAGRGLEGRSPVGPDGAIAVGPYGHVMVLGLTPEQAKAKLASHLGDHLKEPRITLVAYDSAEPPLLRASDDPPATLHPPRLLTHSPKKALPGEPPIIVGGFGPAPSEVARAPGPEHTIEPPDILLIETKQALKSQPIGGPHVVRGDGTVKIGIYGSVLVYGMTIEQATQAIAAHLKSRITDLDVKELNVDVLAYNSKAYYVITDGAGFGENVRRLPVMGGDTVLDAISYVDGLPAVASKKHIWVARRNATGGYESVMPVDWVSITQRGNGVTNYMLQPGDRVYVKADHWRTFDNKLAKILSPFERMLGVTLLGASTVNTINGRNTNNNNIP